MSTENAKSFLKGYKTDVKKAGNYSHQKEQNLRNAGRLIGKQD